MAADNTWSDRVTITPPLTWRECKVSPGVEDIRLEIHEEDGPDGRILTAVAVLPARPSDSWSAHTGQELQFLIDSHPGHEFAGSLRVDWKPVYGEGQNLAERWTVIGRRVVHEVGRLAWSVADDAEPAAAPHRVRIHAHKPGHIPDFAPLHPADCDALRYGERCWFDELVAGERDRLVGWTDWPDAGLYLATATGEGETWIRFEQIEMEG